MVTQNVAEYPQHHVTHGPGKFEVARSTVKEIYLIENTFLDFGIMVTLKLAQQPLHHISYSPAKLS